MGEKGSSGDRQVPVESVSGPLGDGAGSGVVFGSMVVGKSLRFAAGRFSFKVW